MNWRRWPWIEEGVLPLSVVLLRLFWLWPWLLLLGRWTLPPQMRPFLPLWLVAALLLGGALVARMLPVDLARPRRARIWAAGLGLAAMLFTLWWRVARAEYPLWDARWIADEAMTLTHWNGVMPLSIAVLALAGYLWLRGMQDSAAPNHDDIWRAFATGFLALVLLLVAGRVDPAGPPPGIARWILLFFAVGMAALALAGLRLARGTRDTAAPLPSNRYWLASIVAIVAALLVVGLALAFVITPEGVARTMGWARQIVGWIALLLGYVFYAFAYVMFLVLTPLIYWLEEHIGSWLQFNTERLQNMQQGIMETAQQPAPVALPPAVDESLRWLVLLGALAIVAGAFAAAIRILRRRTEEAEDEVRESVLSQTMLREQAASLWRRWMDRLRRGPSGATSPYLSLEAERDTRRHIRAAYQSFLAAMTVHGRARPRSETPRRYAKTAGAYVPAEAEAVDALTDRYIAARYDGAEPSTADATAAETAWTSIRDELERMQRASDS